MLICDYGKPHKEIAGEHKPPVFLWVGLAGLIPAFLLGEMI
jgi:hypothetical protein